MNEVIPSNVNDEAVVFRGCTASEMATLLVSTLLFWGVVMGLLGFIFGQFMAFLSMSIILAGLSTGLLALMLQQIKSGKPEGYYVHVIHRLKNQFGMGKTPLIFDSQVWDTERSKVFIKVDKGDRR